MNEANIIKATIGRRVWYWPSDWDLDQDNNPNYMVASDRSQPCDAGICCVWNDSMVNLTVADHNGKMHARTSVLLLQADQGATPNQAYAQWMPYQAAQAVKDKVQVETKEYTDGTTATGIAPLPELSPHQQRVVDEKAELDGRKGKLLTFLHSDTFRMVVDADEQDRLKEQYRLMHCYSDILGQRIAAFGGAA